MSLSICFLTPRLGTLNQSPEGKAIWTFTKPAPCCYSYWKGEITGFICILASFLSGTLIKQAWLGHTCPWSLNNVTDPVLSNQIDCWKHHSPIFKHTCSVRIDWGCVKTCIHSSPLFFWLLTWLWFFLTLILDLSQNLGLILLFLISLVSWLDLISLTLILDFLWNLAACSPHPNALVTCAPALLTP